MSSTVMLTGNLFSLSKLPETGQVTVTPLIPNDIPSVTGFGVLDDGLLVLEPVVVSLSLIHI